MLEYNEIRQGKIIVYEDEPCEVLDNHVARTQMRKPQNQVKLKSLLSGRTWNATFHAADKADEAEISKKDVKFLYTNKGEFWFCDPSNPKDRFQIKEEIIGQSGQFLKENVVVTAVVWEDGDDDPSTGLGLGRIIKIILPIKMEFMVKEAPPAIKGNTASGGGKTAILENGVKVQVPFFIEAGNMIRINTETGDYVERV